MNFDTISDLHEYMFNILNNGTTDEVNNMINDMDDLMVIDENNHTILNKLSDGILNDDYIAKIRIFLGEIPYNEFFIVDDKGKNIMHYLVEDDSETAPYIADMIIDIAPETLDVLDDKDKVPLDYHNYNFNLIVEIVARMTLKEKINSQFLNELNEYLFDEYENIQEYHGYMTDMKSILKRIIDNFDFINNTQIEYDVLPDIFVHMIGVMKNQGVDIDSISEYQDEYGNTYLHKLILFGDDSENIQTLLEYNPNLKNIRNNDNKTPNNLIIEEMDAYIEQNMSYPSIDYYNHINDYNEDKDMVTNNDIYRNYERIRQLVKPTVKSAFI